MNDDLAPNADVEPSGTKTGIPEWIEPTSRFKVGEDPLALQTITQDRIVFSLLPGILAQGGRARYLSFYAFLLARYAKQRRPPSNQALLRYIGARDLEFAVGVRLCPRHCGSSPVGANAASAALSNPSGEIERGPSTKTSGGGYGLTYASAMQMLGLARAVGAEVDGDRLGMDMLRPGLGMALADAFAEAVSETAYVKDGHIDGDAPIPREVLEEWAGMACLCRLDAFRGERDLLRRALTGANEHVDRTDTIARAEGFGLFLERLQTNPEVGRNDDYLRGAIWMAVAAGAGQRAASYRRAVARWGSVAVTHWTQMAITHLWGTAGPRLRTLDRGGGISRSELREAMADMATGRFGIRGHDLTVKAEDQTAVVDAALRTLVDQAALPDDLVALRQAGEPLAALVQLLLIRASLAAEPQTDPDWNEFARVKGDRQPGLAILMAMIDAHLEGGPSVAQTMDWLMARFVIEPHERTAYSKLPDFTFRFRWESGRLQFSGHPFDRPGPGYIRSGTMSSLTRDLGFWGPESGRPVLTDDGRAFVGSVFAP